MDRRWLHRILLLLCIGSLAVAAEEGNGSGGGDDSAGSTSGPSPDSGEKKKEVLECISCRNCKIFEVTSHSIKCDAESTMCMKGDLPSGEVERICATEDVCEKAKTNSAAYTKVECCKESLCNGAIAWTGEVAVTAAIASTLIMSALGRRLPL